MNNNEIATYRYRKKIQKEIGQLNRITNTYNALDENTDVGIIKCKLQDKVQIEFVNVCALKLFGLTREQFYAEAAGDRASFQLLDDFEAVQNDIKKLVITDKPICFKTKINQRNAKAIWIVGSGNTVIDENGEKSCIFIFRNLDSLQQNNNDLMNSHTDAKNIVSGRLVCRLEEGYPMIYANEEFAKILGYTYEEVYEIGKSGCVDLILPEDRDYVKNEISNQLKRKKSFFVTFRMIKKNNEIIWIETDGVIVEEKGQEDIIRCIVSDINNKKEEEEALMINEKRYNIVINYSDVTTFEYNVRTKKMTFHKSDALEFNLPISIDNAVETIVSSGVISQEHIEDFRTLFRGIEEGEPVGEAVIHGINANKERRILELHITNIFNHHGNPIVAVGLKKDITEKVCLQREKEFANTLTSDKHFMFEANITKNKVVSYDLNWAKEVSTKSIDTISYLNFINTLCAVIIHPEYIDKVSQCLSKEYIMDTFEKGKQLISIIYRRIIDSEHRWFENTVNIIKDEPSGDISIRCYIKDINEKTKKEIAILDEQKFYEQMVSKATSVYIVNVSKNKLVSGHEKWLEIFGIAKSDNYSEIMDIFWNNTVYAADQIEVKNIFSCETILDAYNKGNDKIIWHYRALNSEHEFIWVHCTMNLFEEPNTGDVSGYAYIENIDKEKRKELALMYMAEHDALTGMYNKIYTEKYISDFLIWNSIHDIKHAFFIIDIDYFKSINDNFGHAFGDVILSQVADKIRRLFREEDILGRIGGDEFVVFMKNIQDEKIVLKKAQEICASLMDGFSQNGTNCKISASVGIALYDTHCKTYQELYKHSDSALYVSKENGRNQYTLYNTDINNNSTIKKTVSAGLVKSKIFSHNISENVFRILYEARDKRTGINSVLELVGKHYDVNRAYIFEDSKDGKYTSNTFEWHNENSTSQMTKLKNISYAELGNYMDNFDKNGLFHMVEIDKVSLATQKRLDLQNIKSMTQCLITYDGIVKGFVGFDECRYPRIFEDNEISDFKSISNILGMFVFQIRLNEESVVNRNIAISIVNGLDSYAYVCDPKTHDVLFINNKSKIIAPDAQIGAKCYHAFWNNDVPCKMCPMNTLERKNTNTSEMYNSNLDIWVKTSATQINWLDAEQVCLVNSIDITEYKKGRYPKKLH